jgi:hypothetical protein
VPETTQGALDEFVHDIASIATPTAGESTGRRVGYLFALYFQGSDWYYSGLEGAQDPIGVSVTHALKWPNLFL